MNKQIILSDIKTEDFTCNGQITLPIALACVHSLNMADKEEGYIFAILKLSDFASIKIKKELCVINSEFRNVTTLNLDAKFHSNTFFRKNPELSSLILSIGESLNHFGQFKDYYTINFTIPL